MGKSTTISSLWLAHLPVRLPVRVMVCGRDCVGIAIAPHADAPLFVFGHLPIRLDPLSPRRESKTPVVEAGSTAVPRGDEMVASTWSAAWEHTALVPSLERLSKPAGSSSLFATHIERLTRTVENDRDQIGGAGEVPCFAGCDRLAAVDEAGGRRPPSTRVA